MGVGQKQAVLGDEDDALGVDLQALVEGRGPGGAEPAAEAVAGLDATLDDQRQGTGQFDVRLRQVHPAGGEVDRVRAVAVDGVLLVGHPVGVVGDPVPGGVPRVPLRPLRRALHAPADPGRAGFLRRLGGRAQPEAPQPGPVRADQVEEHPAGVLAGVLREVLVHRLDRPLRMGRGTDQTGEGHARVLEVGRRVGEVVGVGGAEAADEVDDVTGALDHTAQNVGEFDRLRRPEIDVVGLQPVHGGRPGGGVGQGGAHGARGGAGGVVALAARVLEDLPGVRDVGLAGIGEGARTRAGVLALLDGRVVGVDTLVVGLRRLLGRLHALPVELDGLLGPALRPGDGVGVRLQCRGRLVAGVRGVQPLDGVHGELLAEGVGGLALPVRGVQLPHALADLVEGLVEVLEVLGGGADGGRVAVHQFLGVVRLPELPLARGGAQVGGDAVADVLHLVGPAVRPGPVQDVADDVGALVDALADELLARVPGVLRLVEVIAEPHQRASSPCSSEYRASA
jgi:hypothetical protein